MFFLIPKWFAFKKMGATITILFACHISNYHSSQTQSLSISLIMTKYGPTSIWSEKPIIILWFAGSRVVMMMVLSSSLMIWEQILRANSWSTKLKIGWAYCLGHRRRCKWPWQLFGKWGPTKCFWFALVIVRRMGNKKLHQITTMFGICKRIVWEKAFLIWGNIKIIILISILLGGFVCFELLISKMGSPSSLPYFMLTISLRKLLQPNNGVVLIFLSMKLVILPTHF